jgi:hypothetical protein
VRGTTVKKLHEFTWQLGSFRKSKMFIKGAALEAAV